jgi:hypothetical protein
MGVHRRPDSDHCVVEVRWRGYPRIKLSAGTTSKTRARQVETTLVRLKEAGRRDIIDLLVAGKLKLADVHNQYVRDPQALEQLLTRQETPALGPLVDEWLEWLRDPATISPRTHRPYAPRSVERYVESWDALFAALPRGRETPIGDVTRGALAAYRVHGRKKGLTGSTLNRHLSAVQSFLRSSPLMTMRYMKHAPEAYFAEDAARVAASLQGTAKGAVSEATAAPSPPVIRLA